MLSKRQVTANVGEAVEKREPWITAGGNVNCWSDYGKQASQVALVVKNLPANLGQEDPLEKEMAAHFSILAWSIPWTEEPGELQVHEVSKSRTLLK